MDRVDCDERPSPGLGVLRRQMIARRGGVGRFRRLFHAEKFRKERFTHFHMEFNLRPLRSRTSRLWF